MLTSRVVVVAGLVVAAAVTLSSCGSSPPAVALARCAASQLTYSLGSSGAGLGHEDVVVVVHNVGRAECTLRGYPTVALSTGGDGALVSAARTVSGYLGGLRSVTTQIPLATLAASGVASFMVEGTDVPVAPATSCPTYRAMLIAAPGTSRHTSLQATLPGCSRPQVHPVVHGTTGRQ